MNLPSIIFDVLGGAIAVAVIMLVFYGLYRLWLMIKPKPKPTDEIYEKVAEHIASEEPFSKLAEHFSKFKWDEQQKYIRAYTQLNEVKGGNDEPKRKVEEVVGK